MKWINFLLAFKTTTRTTMLLSIPAWCLLNAIIRLIMFCEMDLLSTRILDKLRVCLYQLCVCSRHGDINRLFNWLSIMANMNSGLEKLLGARSELGICINYLWSSISYKYLLTTQCCVAFILVGDGWKIETVVASIDGSFPSKVAAILFMYWKRKSCIVS